MANELVSMLSFKFLASPSLNGFFYWDFSFCFAAVSVAMFLAHLRERSVGWLVASRERRISKPEADTG